ncbi:hypothetical protein [Glacieibacterium frigidum]|uniref:HTH marR-type domain-containing protein n=1 Tax=Glacieibacterium frigidum TaxID=2593303 RepID=A0A552U794_9SPHN|nr:hypothetical protein [Glacieibacterium frigidum]TRW14082.1 hypothetical protein FMM06_10135 [Glacieibacterium frigidum]
MNDVDLIVLAGQAGALVDSDVVPPGFRVTHEPDAASLRRRLGEDWTVALSVVDLGIADTDLIDRLQSDGAPPSLLIGDAARFVDRVNLAPSVRAYLDPDADAGAIRAAAVAALARSSSAVGDFSDRDSSRLNALGREVERIARALNELATEARVQPVEDVGAPFVRAILKRRRDRERYFPAELFSDPAWDMLLDLTAARLEKRSVSVSSLCIAAAVPTTTALRWIRNLCDVGMFERTTDPDDLRRGIITLSDDTAARMMTYLASIRPAG